MTYNFKDITGQRFGRLTVIKLDPVRRKGRVMWECVCDCGSFHRTYGISLRRGDAKSCGCYQRDIQRTGSITHGKSKTPEYRIWGLMIDRCSNPKTLNYQLYGARGIKVCERWSKFENFIADVGPRPSSQYDLDHIDNDGDYQPDNVRWATAKQQARNRRSSRYLTLNGETCTVAEWADRTGIHSRTIRARIDVCGWPVERALTTPV